MRKREIENKGKRKKGKRRKRKREKKRKREMNTDSRNGLGRAPTYNRKILLRVSIHAKNEFGGGVDYLGKKNWRKIWP